MTDDTGTESRQRSDAGRDSPGAVEPGDDGRPYLIGAAVTVVAFAGVAGYTLGSNSPAETATLASVLTLPVSGLSLAAYGVGLAGLVVGLLFGLVSLASRLDDADPG